MNRRLAIGLLGPVISIVAVLVVLQTVNVGLTVDSIAHARLELVLPAILLVALGMVLRAWRWQRLIPARPRHVPVRRVIPVLLIGYLGNAVLPARLGEPIRAYLLARREGLSSFEVLGTALLERIVDVASLALMAFAAAWSLAAPAWVIQLTGAAAVGASAIVVLLIFVGVEPPIRFARRVIHAIGWGAAERFLAILERFALGIGGRSRGRPVAEASGLSIPIWLVDTGVCWLVAVALGVQISPAGALLVVAVGALGTSIPSAPGYVGTYELAASAAGQAVGLPAPTALSLAIVLHAVTLLPVALAGGISLMLLGGGSLGEIAGAAARREELDARSSAGVPPDAEPPVTGLAEEVVDHHAQRR